MLFLHYNSFANKEAKKYLNYIRHSCVCTHIVREKMKITLRSRPLPAGFVPYNFPLCELAAHSQSTLIQFAHTAHTLFCASHCAHPDNYRISVDIHPWRQRKSVDSGRNLFRSPNILTFQFSPLVLLSIILWALGHTVQRIRTAAVLRDNFRVCVVIEVRVSYCGQQNARIVYCFEERSCSGDTSRYVRNWLTRI